MGGLGSGGRGKKKKKHRRTVESCLVLDVNDLSARGCFQPGLFSTCQWLDGSGGIFSIRLRYEAERLFLSYGHQAGGGEPAEEVTEIIPIVRSPCRFGGSQPFFLCPGTSAAVGGVGCGRRVGKLFLAHRYFLCRHCSQIVYAAKSEEPWQRAYRRANKLRQRLGITGPGVPDKPYGMWVSDYERLLEATLQAETKAAEAGTNRILQIIGQIEKRRRRNIQFTL